MVVFNVGYMPLIVNETTHWMVGDDKTLFDLATLSDDQTERGLFFIRNVIF